MEFTKEELRILESALQLQAVAILQAMGTADLKVISSNAEYSANRALFGRVWDQLNK